MFSWLEKEIPIAASVFFRGTWPCTRESFSALRNRGIEIKEGDSSSENAIWTLELSHPVWGEATLFCLREMPMPPEVLIDCDAELTPLEKKEVKACGTSVSLMVKSSRKHLLRDRKHALFFMNAVLGEEGVAALDHISQKFWSRGALEAEASQGADADVTSLFCSHLVTGPEKSSPRWFHTHGLAEIGLFDFDILNPADSVLHTGVDLVRAVAMGILEGNIKKGQTFELLSVGGPMRAVPAREFNAKAPAKWVALREDPSGQHSDDRVVVCDGPRAGLFGKLRAEIAPAKFLMGEIPDNGLLHLSAEDSQRAAERARATYGLFRQVCEELKRWEMPSLVKIGYLVDGSAADKEFLWFQVHEARDHEVDATLLNAPFRIARLKEGDRAVHAVESLSDWQIMTPVGSISPRQTTPLRFLREVIAAKAAEGKDLLARSESDESKS
jgi:hypothetical protein